MTSTAKGNALGEKGILNLTPCKGNSQCLNRVALTIIFAFAKKKGKISFNS